MLKKQSCGSEFPLSEMSVLDVVARECETLARLHDAHLSSLVLKSCRRSSPLSGTQLRLTFEKGQSGTPLAVGCTLFPVLDLWQHSVMCFIQECDQHCLKDDTYIQGQMYYLNIHIISKPSSVLIPFDESQSRWAGPSAPSSSTSSSGPRHQLTSIFFYQIQPSILTSIRRPAQAHNVLSVIPKLSSTIFFVFYVLFCFC